MTSTITAIFALLLVLFCLFFPGKAHAGYLDPGSGSIFVQTLVSILSFFGRIVNKIKSFFSRGGK